MLRIIRTRTLTGLREQADRVDGLAEQVEVLSADAERATDSLIRADLTAEDLLTRLGKALAAQLAAERETEAVRDQLARVRADVEAAARKELDEIHAEVAKLQADAADPVTGQTMRAGIAYGVLHRLYLDVLARGVTPDPALTLVALVLGFDVPDADGVPKALTAFPPGAGPAAAATPSLGGPST